MSSRPRNASGNDVEPDDGSIAQQLDNLRWVAYGIVAPIIIAVGVVGNVANLAVLSRPNLKSVTYVYLMWLAITDLLCQLFVIPSLVHLSGEDFDEVTENYSSVVYHAHVELALINGLMAASVFIVVALTVDRYVSISKPTKFKKIHTFRRARWTIAAACVTAILLNMPMCFYKSVVEVQHGNATYYCVLLNSKVVNHSAWHIYLWTKEILTRLGPALLLGVLNFVIIRRFLRLVKKRKQRLRAAKAAYRPTSTTSSAVSCLQDPPSMTNSTIPVIPGASNLSSTTATTAAAVASVVNVSYTASSSTGTGSSFREERRLVMLLGGIVVMFFVAMTPAAFVSLFNADELAQNFHFQLFRAFANDMEFLNYAMNFYVYCLCSSEIRRTFVQLLCCRKGIPQEPMMSTQQQQNLMGVGVSEEPDPRKSSSPSFE